MGQPEEALAAATRIAEAAPDDTMAMLDVAELSLELGRHDEALAAFERMRAIDDLPDHEVYALHGHDRRSSSTARVATARSSWPRGAPRCDRGRSADDARLHLEGGGEDEPPPSASRSTPRWPPASPSTAASTPTTAVRTEDHWLSSRQPETAPRPPSGGAARPARRSSTTSACSATSASAPSATTTSGCASRERLEQLLDEGSFEELGGDLEPVDALGFADTKPYPERIAEAQRKRGDESEARLRARRRSTATRWSSRRIDFGFIGGSMGAAVGEAITRAAELALESARRCSSSPPPAARACRRAASR